MYGVSHAAGSKRKMPRGLEAGPPVRLVRGTPLSVWFWGRGRLLYCPVPGVLVEL